jgi:hypothetical protein
LDLAVQRAFGEIRGTASIALFCQDVDALILATNNGSLFMLASQDGKARIFASERYIIQQLVRRPSLHPHLSVENIVQLAPGCGWIIDLNNSQAHSFSLLEDAKQAQLRLATHPTRHVQDHRPKEAAQAPANLDFHLLPAARFKCFEIDLRPIQSLRRCTRCVLPETMPFIEFDDQGVCNFCRQHKPLAAAGLDALREAVEPYRSRDGRPDCLVTFSGGRDSSFGVHTVKTVLEMNPVAYTYDWGMVTDLARRNQARLCGKLGIEHILVSADIRRKRDYIRKNVSAWLKRPDLGTVPLFMAGDKQYFYYANQLQRKMDINLAVICINPFERTNFKTGFCGVRQPFQSESNYALSMANQIKLAAYYGRAYLLNPAYLNSSIPDTLGAFASYYLTPHRYLNLFRYIYWDEAEINRTLLEEYDWETAVDTRSTWRIGDGTASFYNYIYYCAAGFTENDTFRSNQIREGRIERAEALERVYEENQPRFDSIQWYCHTIEIDVDRALERIVRMPKRYPM